MGVPAEGREHMRIYFFGSDWSFPCVESMETWERFKNGHPELEASYIDVRRRPDLAKRYLVSKVPTFISVDNVGREYKRLTRQPTTIDLRDLLR